MRVSSVLSVPPTHTFSHALLSKEQTLQDCWNMWGTPALTKPTKVTDDRGSLHDQKLHCETES